MSAGHFVSDCTTPHAQKFYARHLKMVGTVGTVGTEKTNPATMRVAGPFSVPTSENFSGNKVGIVGTKCKKSANNSQKDRFLIEILRSGVSICR